MIELLNLGAQAIACRVTGKIDRDDLTRLSGEIDHKAAGDGRLRVYAEVGDLSFMNLIGVSQDLKAFAGREQLLNRIDRAAVVTDSALVAQGMQFANRLPASLELRLFPTAEAAQARVWIDG